MLAQLIPLQGGEPITIDKDVTIVGRQREHCDLVLDRKSVSKIHCVIARTDGLLFVRDLSSTNGTKVNGQRILRGALLPGDKLSFAGEKFLVHMGPSPEVVVSPDAAAVSPGAQTQEMSQAPAFFSQAARIDDETLPVRDSVVPIDVPDESLDNDDLLE